MIFLVRRRRRTYAEAVFASRTTGRAPCLFRLLAVCPALALAVAVASTRAAAGAEEATAVSFSKEIAPLLQQKCVTCHGPEKTKGGLQLHTYEALRRGGESKEPSVTPGDPAKSKIYQLLVAKDPDDRMPQKDDPLPEAQVRLVERWIREGASFDGPDPKAPLASLRPPVIHPSAPVEYARPVPVPALCFSPDGRLLAAAGYHEVTLWNAGDGTLAARWTNVEQQTLALAYSPDGSLLAIGGGTPGRSGEVRLLDGAHGQLVKLLVTIGDLVTSLAFSPDGQTLAAGGADNVIRFFEVSSGREQRRIEQHADWVMGLAFSPDGARLASASRDKSARLFDVKTGELEETYTGHAQPVFAVAWSGDGKSLFTAGRDKSIHAWQAKEAKKLYEISGFESDVWRLLVESNRLFACTDREIRQYKLNAKNAELTRTFSGHHDVVYALAYQGSADLLASGGYDGDVRIWNGVTGELVRSFLAAPGYKPATVTAAPPGPAEPNATKRARPRRKPAENPASTR